MEIESQNDIINNSIINKIKDNKINEANKTHNGINIEIKQKTKGKNIEKILFRSNNKFFNCLGGVYQKYHKLIRILSLLIYITIIYLSNLSIFFESKYGPTKSLCMCVIAKNENKYIREFLKYYKNYDVDKVYIFDNNDINGENFEDVITDYIESGFVKLINYKGLSGAQLKAFNDCYEKYNKLFDWLIFFDVDEFIYLKDFISIKLFLNNTRFNKCERVQFTYIFHTDNNLIYYDNRTLRERFPERCSNLRKKVWDRSYFKSIVRGQKAPINIKHPHYLNTKFQGCNAFGKKVHNKLLHTLNADYKYYYIIHYYSKSLEEFLDKVNKTDVVFADDIEIKIKKIQFYFKLNKITKEKLDYVENKTNFNLSYYRNKKKIL